VGQHTTLEEFVDRLISTGWDDGWNAAIKAAAKLIEKERGDRKEIVARAQAIRSLYKP
jgi:hypothetical protein